MAASSHRILPMNLDDEMLCDCEDNAYISVMASGIWMFDLDFMFFSLLGRLRFAGLWLLQWANNYSDTIAVD